VGEGTTFIDSVVTDSHVDVLVAIVVASAGEAIQQAAWIATSLRASQ
jgi:hypothetical protein